MPAVSSAHLKCMSTNHLDGLEQLISIDELSECLGVPVKTIYDWRLTGHGPCAATPASHGTDGTAPPAAVWATTVSVHTSVDARAVRPALTRSGPGRGTPTLCPGRSCSHTSCLHPPRPARQARWSPPRSLTWTFQAGRWCQA